MGMKKHNSKNKKKIISITIVLIIILATILMITVPLFNSDEPKKEEYSGKIIDYFDKLPIPDVWIKIYRDSTDPWASEDERKHVKTVKTDSKGEYKVDLPRINENSEKYVFHSYKVGYVNAYSLAYNYPNNLKDKRQRLDKVENTFLAPTGSISGIIKDENNNGINNANIVVGIQGDFSSSGYNITFHMENLSYERGYFTMDHLWATESLIFISAEGYKTKKIENFSILKHQPNNMKIILERQDELTINVSGNVLCDDKKFVNSLMIFFDEESNLIKISKVNEDGKFVIDIPPGNYTICPYALWFESDYPEYWIKDDIQRVFSKDEDIKIEIIRSVTMP
jgi:flagellar basal body-associated protein FliL